jgi:hypothetical protein
LLSLCRRFSLKLEKEHKYSLFEWDPANWDSRAGVERVIYVLKK